MSNTIKVSIAKAKTEIEVVFEDLPTDVQLYIVEQGLSKLLNAATAKLTKDKIEEENLSTAQVADQALGLANKRLDELKAGKIKRSRASTGKVPGVVMTEARRLAKNIVKAAIKAAGGRISDYEAKAITEAANLYISENPEVVAQAAKTIEDAKAMADAVKDTIGVNTPASAEKKAKNDAKKAKAKKAKVEVPLPVVAMKGGRVPAPTVHATSH